MRLKYPEIPVPRSRLAPLKPIGLGTPSAESVESYVLRLAREHRVTRFHIESLVSGSGEGILYKGMSRQPFRLDAPIETAKEFARRLAMLTHVAQVETMGLGWLAGKVAFSGALRDHRAWCSVCIGQRQARGLTPYMPVAWLLTSYEGCLEHGGCVQMSCPSCSKRISVRREWAWPFDTCPHCSCSLAAKGATAVPSFRDLERRHARRLDQRAAANIGELISSASSLENLEILDLPDLPRVVKSGIARGRAEHAAGLAKLAGVPKSTLHGLAVARSSRPSLDILARLSVIADVSIVGTLVPALWKEGSAAGKEPSSMPFSARRERRRVTRDELHRAITAELMVEKPCSPYALAMRIGGDAAHLRRTFPEAAKELSLLCHTNQALEFESTRLRFATLIRDQISNRSRGGKRISMRSTAISLGVLRNNRAFRAAWYDSRSKN